MITVNIPWRLTHIHLLLNIAVEKSILDIDLSERPATGHGDRQNQPHSGGFDNRGERVGVVDTLALSEAFGNESSLVSIH
jgi:hypothetical protein